MLSVLMLMKSVTNCIVMLSVVLLNVVLLNVVLLSVVAPRREGDK